MTINTSPRLGLSEVEALVRNLVHIPELFDLARERIRLEMFDRPGEEELSLIWSACLETARMYNNRLPADTYLAWSQVAVLLQSRLDREVFEDAATIENRLFDEATGLMGSIFDPNAPSDRVWGRRLLMQFLQEREVQDQLVRAVQASDYHKQIADLPTFLRDLQARHQRIETLATSPVRSAAPRDYRPADLQIGSTGLSFLDDVFGGGDAPREVYGILGAFGSGKTLLAVQAAVAKARQYQVQHFVHGEPLRHVYLFHYEAPYDEILRRTWACAARIRMDRLQSLDTTQLTDVGDPLLDYERVLMAQEIAEHGEDYPPREAERLLMAQQEIGVNLWLCDFGNTDDNAQRGSGYVPEIVAALEQERQNGREIGSVYVDYVGTACKRYLATLSRPRQDEMRHLVGDFGNLARLTIAQPMAARVYLFHQLSSSANSRSFMARQHFSDAAEGRNFAENLHFCATLGTRDREFNCVQFDCSKARRAPLLANPPLLHMRGDLACFEVAQDLTINPVLGRPVRRGEATVIQGGSQPTPAANGTRRVSPFTPPDDALLEDYRSIED